VLGDHVRNPDIGPNLDHLRRAKTEPVTGPLAVPLTVGAFRLRPPPGDRQDEVPAQRALTAAYRLALAVVLAATPAGAMTDEARRALADLDPDRIDDLS
jgi:hypothetical protein